MLIRQNRGFALLFVLIIASLIALSVSIFYTQNHITYLHIQREKNEQQARSGALLALNLAVARLQKFAGSDDVISLKAANFNDELQLKTEALKHVNGLWKISKEKNKYFTKFLCWLSSQRNSSDFHGIQTLNKTDSVFLIKNSQYTLQVPKRRIAFSGHEGEVYWAFIIEDESQKIDLSLVDSSAYLNSEFSSTICPQRPNLEAVTTFFAYQPDLAIYPYIDFPEQFFLIDHDLGNQVVDNQNLCTLHSYGIWSNLDGLKRELNFFLNTNDFQDTDTIFEPEPTCAVLPPTWKMLKSFVQQMRSAHSNTIKPRPFAPVCRPEYKKNYSQNATDDELKSPTEYGIYPILTQVLFDIIAAIDGEYLTIKICPKFILWNPYNISLQLTEYQVDTNLFLAQISDQIAVTFIGHPVDNQMPEVVQTIPLTKGEIKNNSRTFWSTKCSTSFSPGEAKIFSLQNDYNFSDIAVSRSVPGNYKNCFIIYTGLKIADFSDFTFFPTDQDGRSNKNWNSWSFWLISDGQICQEIAQVAHNQTLSGAGTIFSPTDREKVICSCAAYLKTALPQDVQGPTGVHWLHFANPRAPYVNRAMFYDPASLFFGQDFISGNWSWQLNFSESEASINTAQLNFLSGLVLFDIPATSNGLGNIMALRHVNWTPFGYLPAFTFGNSNANPYIPLDLTFVRNSPSGTWPSHANVEALFDYAYLLNETLFDNFFCTSQNNFYNNIDNQRVKQIYVSQNISAENALIKGAFNIHTIDVEPWLAYLSAISTPEGNVIFPRMDLRKNRTNLCQNFNYNTIKILAQSIVNLIIKRQCFPSLSAFVNRQPDGPMQHHGLIQQAIEDSHINASVQKNRINFAKNKSWFDDSSALTYLESGLPNVVDQADVLQTISNFFTTRGDTFKITAYGEYRINDKIITKKCEAIVQRFPEFVNVRENAPHDKNLSQINQALGRRFKIILFRWCN